MKSNLFNSVLNRQSENRTDIWLKEQIKKIIPINPRKDINSNRHLWERWTRQGKLYLFLYDPETKRKLKYYDTYPLVIPITKKPVGKKNFTGINLHYLHPNLRENIVSFIFENPITESEARIRFNIDRFMRDNNKRDSTPIIKSYSYKNVKSHFLKIPENEYHLITSYPADRFKKRHKSVVWQKTERRIRNGI